MSDLEAREKREKTDTESTAEELSILTILAVLLRERRFILACTAVTSIVALVMVLLTDRVYSASFSFVPQQAADPGRAGLASLAGQFDLAGLGGSSSSAQSPQFYADLLSTREVLVPIATERFVRSPSKGQMSLADFFEISGAAPPVVLEKTLRKMRSVITTSVATRTTGVVSVNVRTPSPSVSLAIAQRLRQGVNDFDAKTRRTQGSEERRFIESQLIEARASLRVAEDAAERFLMAHRINNTPRLEFQRGRLTREAQLQQQVVVSLVQKYEEARIREMRDTPVITLIEKPAVAAQPDPRGGLVTLVMGTMLGLFIGVAGALLRNVLRRLRASGADPAFIDLMHEWEKLRLVPRRASPAAD